MLYCQLGGMLDPHIQILEIHGAKGAETFQYIKAISKNQRILKESKIHKTECHTQATMEIQGKNSSKSAINKCLEKWC